MKQIVCPKCGSTDGIENVMCDVDATSLITLDPQGDCQYGWPEITGVHSEQYYQCTSCGHVLAGISDTDEFLEWMKENTKEVE